jgi:hypothetical protein
MTSFEYLNSPLLSQQLSILMLCYQMLLQQATELATYFLISQTPTRLACAQFVPLKADSGGMGSIQWAIFLK